MNDSDLKAIFRAEEKDSLGFLGSQLSADRGQAMDYYFQRPFGNEVEGRSQVVTSDVSDTVDWILPSLLRIFTSGPEVVRFDPTGPEDEEAAQQATDYINHVFHTENPGFLLLHAWFKDALLQKNGMVKVWYDTSDDVNVQNYPSLEEPDALALAKDPETDIISRTENEDGTIGLSVRKTKGGGRSRVAGVPPEEFLISRDAKTIDEARFVGHRRKRMASDLIAEGYRRSLIDAIPGDDDAMMQGEERSARSRYNEDDTTASTLDKATRQITVTEGYLRVDYDGDGIAELRMVTMAGEVVLENEPVDVVPFADLTPVPMSHRWAGRSIAELVMDLQLIKSTLWRQALDNMYLTTNQRTEIVDGQVNLDDLLTSRPGGAVRVKAAGMMREIQVTPTFQHALGMIEYIDTVKEKRTGVTSYNQGVDANSLNKTAHGLQNILNQAQQRIELIARIFAETGVRRLFKLLLRCESKYTKKAKTIRLRNKWVPMDPANWASEMDVAVSVGLGTGNREQVMGQLMNLAGLMREQIMLQRGVDGPFVTRENIWNMNKAISENSGFKSPEMFFTDPTQPQTGPDGQPMQQPMQPDPAMAAEAMKGQIEQAKLQIEQMKLRGEAVSQERKDVLAAQQMQLEHMREMAKVDVQAKTAQQSGQIEVAKLADGHMARQQDRFHAVQDRVEDRQAMREDGETSRGHEIKMKNSERVSEGQPLIDHEAEMQKIADAIMQAGQQQQQSMMQAMQAIAQAQMQSTQALVAAITAPKRTNLITDAAGKPIASEQVVAPTGA